MNDTVADFLRTIIRDKESGLLFLSRNHNLIATNQVNYPYANVLKEHGIVDTSVYGKVDLHSLRQSYATNFDKFHVI